ncbi:MAG: prepilin-type N-terminal cleavage/methylation domain-containing protein [Candidatus Hadarchaeum sp.]
MLSSNKGFTLTELLVAMVVGLFIVGGTLAIYATTVSANAGFIRTARLNQELRAAVDLISRDIRRAGYRHDAQNDCLGVGYVAYNTNCTAFNAITITASGSQIEFAYDETSGNAGVIDNGESHGYRLSGGVIQSKVHDGSNYVWQDVTDGSNIVVTSLLFTPNTQTIDLDGAGPGTASINIRTIAISISGRLAADSSVTRQLTEIVRLRNDAFTP